MRLLEPERTRGSWFRGAPSSLLDQRGAHLRDRARGLGALALLQATLPISVGVSAVAALRRAAPAVAPSRPRTVLLSGGKMTKALQLARSFHAAGHRVVLVESARYAMTGHRASRAVDAFRVLPDQVGPDGVAYVEALVAIARQEGVDVYVPVCSPASSRHDALAKAALEAVGVEVVHLGPERLDEVDDKFRFARLAGSLGLRVPDTHLITEAQQVLDHDFTGAPRPYVLKSIAYDPVHRLDLTRLPMPDRAAMERFVHGLPISPDNPWILQEFIEGREFCTHGTARDGQLTVWCCCRSSAFQVTYAPDDQPDIEAWVRTFVGRLGLTGQVSFDFIRADDDGEAYAIECNPRTHSAITMLHDHPDLAAAYLGDVAGDAPPVRPLPGSRSTYWLHHELWGLLRHPSTAPERVRRIARGKDAIFARGDPWPSLLVPHRQLATLLVRSVRTATPFIRVDVNIGKLVQPAGD